MGQDTASMRFFYGSVCGRTLLKVLLKLGLTKLMAAYLQSSFSKGSIPRFIKKYNIQMDDYPKREYKSFADFFARKKDVYKFDVEPSHLISPCDGWLSAFQIEPDSVFEVKGTRYSVRDFLDDSELAKRFEGGTCLIFRLTPADYHHFAFVDDATIGERHYLEGALHSVQPIALSTVPVFRVNRRCWHLLKTKNFGEVAQIEVGALAVGGFVYEKENADVKRGEEMGYFDLWGSTIVQLFQKDSIELIPEIAAEIDPDKEFHICLGTQIGIKKLSTTCN